MPKKRGVTIAIVCEADADRRIVCDLIDRILCAEVGRITRENLDNHRAWWQPPGRSESFLKVSQVGTLARENGVAAHGGFSDEVGKREDAAPYARRARLAFLLLSRYPSPPNVVAFVVDSDNDAERRRGCEQARRGSRNLFDAIVIGLAHPMRECWVLASFQPRSPSDTNKLKKIYKDLRFNPCLHSHRLNAKNEGSNRHPKRVLKLLVDDEEACWRQCDLQTLESRGAQNGLTAFIEEVKAQLVPLCSHAGNRP
jgi:hypothetical protein